MLYQFLEELSLFFSYVMLLLHCSVLQEEGICFGLDVWEEKGNGCVRALNAHHSYFFHFLSFLFRHFVSTILLYPFLIFQCKRNHYKGRRLRSLGLGKGMFGQLNYRLLVNWFRVYFGWVGRFFQNMIRPFFAWSLY